MRQVSTRECTRYELVAKGDDGQEILVGYTPRKNVAGIIDMLLKGLEAPNRRIDMLSRATGVDPVAWETLPRGKGIAVVAPGWRVQFSGRTQRDAAATGELTHSIYRREYSV